jgi:D-alanyl-D-alanine carboxypeptidase (penicillin-binding protein 5/6)
MKRMLTGLLVAVCSAAAFANTSMLSTQAQALASGAQGLNPIPAANTQPLIIPAPPTVDAKGYVVMDANSGKVIAQKAMGTRMQPASLTKLMTLYITFQTLAQGQIQLDDKVRISEGAWRRGGSRMFLKLGSLVPVQKLIEGVIVASGNDACTALAEYIAGNEKNFAQLMNQTAARLGMQHSHFVDSTGLPRPDHFSTPHDLAILAQHIIHDYPQYYHFFSQKWITYNGIRQPNRNRLLWRDPVVDGLKTGHTKAAGFCLIASGEQKGTRLISVVMGTPSDSARANDSQALLNWGFRFYKSYKLYSANQPIKTPRIYFGQNKTTPMGSLSDVLVTIPVGAYNQLKATLAMQPKLSAPLNKGQTYGTLNITLNGKPLRSVPLVALQDNPKGGLWTRLTDRIAILFNKGN